MGKHLLSCRWPDRFMDVVSFRFFCPIYCILDLRFWQERHGLRPRNKGGRSWWVRRVPPSTGGNLNGCRSRSRPCSLSSSLNPSLPRAGCPIPNSDSTGHPLPILSGEHEHIVLSTSFIYRISSSGYRPGMGVTRTPCQPSLFIASGGKPNP